MNGAHPHLGAVWTLPSKLGPIVLWAAFIFAILAIGAYVAALCRKSDRGCIRLGRAFYTASSLCILSAFGLLLAIVYGYHFEYIYAFEHTGVGMQKWYRLAAAWSGQEGSFLLWACWTCVIGFLVFFKAGKYEKRIMPFYISMLAMLAIILVFQSPYHIIPAPSAAEKLANPDWFYPRPDGLGLNPSLQNYWMTIHPPTIFFGFASLLVPFCYAIAALIWKDYKDWTSRVMPYALLSCGTLGIGLFMGGRWAYETQGWHGFWAWDPVENASFFPWLAVTALVHGLVVQKSRGGMARTNTFLGVLAFWLFLVGTFLTRSGVLSKVSIHSFVEMEPAGVKLLIALMVIYGLLGFGLWLFRLFDMPGRKTTGDTLVSRDFAFFLGVTLMVLACVFVTLGTTAPVAQQMMHKTLSPPQPVFYNRSMMPIAILAGLLLGCVPWLAWRKTDPDTFLRRLIGPWLLMILFGTFLLIWVIFAERAWAAAIDPTDEAVISTMHAWVSTNLQRVSVVLLGSVGFLAMFSNAALAFRVFRAKPLAAGGWLAHVGIGILLIGVVVSNTYERTERFMLIQGGPSKDAFGYQFQFEKITGKPYDARPLNPDYDKTNAVVLRVTPPESEGSQSDGTRTFFVAPRWFVYNLSTAHHEFETEAIRWPDIKTYLGHDLYVGLAGDPDFLFVDPSGSEHQITLMPKQKTQVGDYTIGYYDRFGDPGRNQGVKLAILKPDGTPVMVSPYLDFEFDDTGKMRQVPEDYAIPEIRDSQGVPGVARLDAIDPGTLAATISFNLPGADTTGLWRVPAEITYKPWVNLVWIGVIIAVLGIFLAAVNRSLEVRRVVDGPGSLTNNDEPTNENGDGEEYLAGLFGPARKAANPAAGGSASRSTGNRPRRKRK